MVTIISLINRSAFNAESRLCANWSQSVDNNSRRLAAAGCLLDDEWGSLEGDIELRELFQNVTLGVVLIAACLLTIVGNTLVLHAVRTERKLQTVCQVQNNIFYR